MVELCISELGSKHWFQNELYHRANGPAVIDHNGKWWCWHGRRVDEFEHMMLSAQQLNCN